MEEIFKDIPNYEGLYQVSDLGNVKSLHRGKEKILKSNKGSSGYLSVKLYVDSKNKTFLVHKLVAICFLDHVLDGTYNIIVDHKDNNPENNKLSNLQLISVRLNCSKDKANKTSKYTGVSWSKQNKKWYSCLTKNKKTIPIGHFDTELEAHTAYKNKIKEITL